MKLATGFGLRTSISRQLVAAFGAGLVAAIVLGIICQYGVQSVSSRIEAAANDSLPKVTEMAALATVASRMETDLVTIFQAGGDADEGISLLASEVAHLQDLIDEPQETPLQQVLNRIAADVEMLAGIQSANRAMQVQAADEMLALPQFMDGIWQSNGEYIATLSRAARFDDFGGVLLDPAATPFALWRAGITDVDPALAPAIDRYAAAESAMIVFARDEIASNARRPMIRLAQLRTDLLPEVQTALTALRDDARTRMEALETQREATLSDLRYSLELFSDEITTAREAAIDAMRDSVAAAGEQAEKVQRITWIALAAVAAGALLAGYAIIARIGRPLRGIHMTLDALAQGKEAADIPWIRRKDEIGAISRSVADCRDAAPEAGRRTRHRAASPGGRPACYRHGGDRGRRSDLSHR